MKRNRLQMTIFRPAVTRTLSALMLGLLAGSPAFCETFGDKAFSLTFDDATGRLTDLRIEGASVTGNQPGGGFFYREYRGGTPGQWRRLAGTFSGTELTAADGPYRLAATFTASEQTIRIDGTVARSGAAVDHGIQLRVRLPVDAKGWTYWEDPRHREPIDSDSKRYVFERWTTWKIETRAVSRYPFFGVSPASGHGVSIGVPLDSPNVFRLAYEQNQGVYAEFDLGLHSVQQGGPHAPFSLIVYPHQGRWGLRSVARGYYDRLPHLFAKRIPADREGGWFAGSGADLKAIGNPGDFALAFDEHAQKVWRWDQKHSIYSMEYAEPWNYYIRRHPSHTGWHARHSDGGARPTYDEVVACLKEGLQSSDPRIRDGSKAALASAVRRRNGKLRLDYRYWKRNGYWHVIVHTICFPGTPYNMFHWTREHQYKKFLDQSIKAGAPLRGWYFDANNLSGKDEDFEVSHFALPDMRLSLDYETGRACLFGWLGSYQFVEWWSKMLHDEGRILFANGTGGMDQGAHYYYAHLYDAGGIEGGIERPNRSLDYIDREQMIRRFCWYRRALSTLDNEVTRTKTPLAEVEARLQNGLFYGMWIGPNWLQKKRAAQIHAIRPLFKKYTPLFRELAVAGWQPVTFATSPDSEIWLERFGGDKPGHLYIAARNGPASTSISSTISLELGDDGLGGTIDAGVIELISKRTVPVTTSGSTASFAVQIAPQETQLFRVILAKQRGGAE